MPHMTVLWRAIQLQFRGEAWKDGGTRPEQPCISCHLSRPPSELGRVFLVPVQPREAVFPARILSCCREPKTVMPDLPACQPACLKKEVLERFLFFCVCGAGIRGVQSRRPLSIAASRFLLQFWTGTAATAWHFGTVIGNQNLLRLSALTCPPLPLPMSPFRLDLTTTVCPYT